MLKHTPCAWTNQGLSSASAMNIPVLAVQPSNIFSVCGITQIRCEEELMKDLIYCYGLNCASQKRYVGVLPVVHVDVMLFGIRVVADVIKVRWY